MNMTMRHLATMLGVGALGVVVLLAVGLPPATALVLALIIACPVMMVGMMLMMGANGMSHGTDPKAQDQAAHNLHR